MGALKEIREQQGNVLQQAKTLGNTLYLAGLGAYSKAGDSSEELYGKYLQAGQEAYGDKAESKSNFQLAGRGMVVSTRKLIDEVPAKRHQLYQQFVTSGKQERGEKAEQTHQVVLAGLGAVSTLREQSQKLFDELVSTGEKERA